MIPTAPTDLLSLALAFALMSLVPLIVVTTTSFMKISLVLLVLRNALGVQQVPPTLAIYGIALSMTVFVMAPTLQAVGKEVSTLTAGYGTNVTTSTGNSSSSLIERARAAAEPMRKFMDRFAGAAQKDAMLANAKRLWPADMAKEAKPTDFLILLPAFVISELQAGYEIGFLIYIPFVVIDLLISNLLMALGMQQVSPQTISIPLKLLLFVMVDGWGRLLNALAMTYQ
ncbi:type III secretion system export apparatus subunit SctR [Ideonella sp. DXS29W]|uniref:Type III secretion system export apparatus subunit SctR n=1 Tax=Ideonella lacteola TaxID=2984193 RepID=A0ABU9BJ18_9BURK